MKTNRWKSKIGGAILAMSFMSGLAVLSVAILAMSFMSGLAVLSVEAQAQNPDDRYSQDRNADQNRRGRDWDRYGNYGGSSELRQTALNAGYNEGIRDGRRDRMNGRHARYEDSNTYRRGTKDYSSRLGDRELYRRYFREAYENGYGAESNAPGNRNGDYGDNRDRDRDRDRDNGDRNRNGRNSDGYGDFGGSAQLRQTALNAGFSEGVKQGRTDRKNRDDHGFQGRFSYQNATKDYSSRLGDREIYQRYFREAFEHGYADGISGH